MPYQDRITFHTAGHGDMHDVTADVQRVVRQAKVATGIVHVFVVGSTAAVGAIEFEPGLQRDLPEALDQLIPPGHEYWHEQTWHDGNGHSHLQATLMGPSLTVPIAQGQLILGTWQQIILLECDTRPRDRMLIVTVLGE